MIRIPNRRRGISPRTMPELLCLDSKKPRRVVTLRGGREHSYANVIVHYTKNTRSWLELFAVVVLLPEVLANGVVLGEPDLAGVDLDHRLAVVAAEM